MSAPLAIRVQDLSKAYTMWASPAARLHSPLLGRIGRLPFLPSGTREACRRLSHGAFREHYALRNLSLEVPKGASIGVIGRNGSGKSTLLQILAGTLQPTSGKVEVNGSVAALLELGSGFDVEFSGRENVYLNAAIRGLTRRQTDAKMDEILAFADIGDFIDQPLRTYSSGMIIRLAFAVSACIEPDILVVDEALSVGDIFFQQKCIRHMHERMKGVTKVFVTHDLQAAISVTDFVYVLEGGEIVFGGRPKDAVEHYMKLSHSVSAERSPERGAAPAAGDPESRTEMPDTADLPWVEVKPEARGGVGEIRIDRVAVTGPAGDAVQTVRPRDRTSVHLGLRALQPKEHVIVGYIIADRLGNWICGENTCSVADGVFPLAAGDHVVQFDFDWPEIRPGDYTITLGVGEGTMPLHHVIQCWAHNIVSVSAVSPDTAFHGLFNNPLMDLRIDGVATPDRAVGANGNL